MASIQDIIGELAKLRSNSTFLVLHKYRNDSGELADYNIVFHISYENALRKSIAIVEEYRAIGSLAKQAKAEVLEGLCSSLEKIATLTTEEIDPSYDVCINDDGDVIKGIKVHRASSVLHLYGLVHQKKVLEPGIYKESNRRPLTVEKDAIRRLTPVSRFRQFRILPERLEKISVCGMELLPTVV